MNVIRQWYRVPAAAGTSVDSALRGRGIWLEGNAVWNRRVVRPVHNAREARICNQRSRVRQDGAGHRTMAVTTAVRIGWGVAFAITLASDVVAGEFAHHILTIMAVLIAVVVVTVVAVRTAFSDRMLVIGYCQMQMNSESRRQRRQDRYCDEQMTNA